MFFYYCFANKFNKQSEFKNFLWENEHRSPYILLQISASSFIPNNIYFFEERMYLKITLWNAATVSNVHNSRLPTGCLIFVNTYKHHSLTGTPVRC